MKTGYVAFSSSIGKARIFQESFYGEESYLIILKDDNTKMYTYFVYFVAIIKINFLSIEDLYRIADVLKVDVCELLIRSNERGN